MEKKTMRKRTHENVDKIMNKAESMSQSGKETMAHVKNKAIMTKTVVDGYIKKNPKKSVLIATGTGMVTGAVTTAALMRKKHKNKV